MKKHPKPMTVEQLALELNERRGRAKILIHLTDGKGRVAEGILPDLAPDFGVGDDGLNVVYLYGLLTDEDEKDIRYYLRVETSHGTLQLPGDIYEDDPCKIVFNWIVFEEDTTIYSTQLIRTESPQSGGIVEELPIGDKDILSPADPMQFVPAHETGCFVERLPR